MCQINLVQCINHKIETKIRMKRVGLSCRLNVWWKSRILISLTQGVILQCVAVKLLLRVYWKKKSKYKNSVISVLSPTWYLFRVRISSSHALISHH